VHAVLGTLSAVRSVRARLKHTCGPLSNVALYALFFLPTSINAAWLSIATGLGVLIVPVSYGVTANMDVYAVVVAAVVTVLGVPCQQAPAGSGRVPDCVQQRARTCLAARVPGNLAALSIACAVSPEDLVGTAAVQAPSVPVC